MCFCNTFNLNWLVSTNLWPQPGLGDATSAQSECLRQGCSSDFSVSYSGCSSGKKWTQENKLLSTELSTSWVPLMCSMRRQKSQHEMLSRYWSCEAIPWMHISFYFRNTNVVGWPSLASNCPPSPLLSKMGEKIRRKSSQVRWGQGDHSPCTFMGKTGSNWGRLI